MERVSFGRTGLEVSRLGFGGATFAFTGQEEVRVTSLLNGLLDQGLNLIDTGACYEHSEEWIGRAVGHRRDDYVLVTKCGHEVEGATGERWSAELVTSTVERALRRLRTDCIDVMLLHTCELEVLEQGDALGALVAARDAGKIRFAGFSGDNESAAYAASLPDVDVLQVSVSICDQVNIDTVLPVAREQGVGVMVKRPIANAAWKDDTDQHAAYIRYASEYARRLAAMSITPGDLGFDGPPSAVWPEIALRFTLSHPDVHIAIVGTTNPAHVRANLAAAAKGPLLDTTIAALRSAFASAADADDQPWAGRT